ncbi:MAG: efflux RND transporter periplasmic adaptor subunit [Xylophilus ampelinus]
MHRISSTETILAAAATAAPRRPASARAALAAPALLALMLLAGCGKSDEKPAAAAQAKAAPEDPMVVKVRPEMASNFKVGPLQTANIAPMQEISGRVEANERQVSRIGASVTGRVTEVLAELGDRVRAGQVMARVASPDLTTAQLAVMRANSSVSLAGRAVERARQLIAADVIGTAEVQRREAELAIARAELQAATDQLRLMGISADAVNQLRTKGTLASAIGVASNRTGVVIERTVSQGQVAQPGDPMFTVADLSNVWVVGALPEQAAGTVEAGQAVEIRVPALGDEPLAGKIIYVGDTVQADTRTLAIRTQVDNPGGQLKPQMLATMRISGSPKNVPAVPTTAVVREADRDHIFVRTAENTFKLVPVELGTPSNGMRPVLQGAKPGTEIVQDGAFHLNNERKRAELE